MPGRAPPPVPAAVGRVRFAAAKAAWLWLNGAGTVAALALPPSGLLLPAILAALSFATLCLGHSVGLHRGLIHGSFTMKPGLRRVLLGLFALTGLGGPLSWIRLHVVRDFWQNRTDCPPYFAYRHSLLRDFWWNLHCRFEPQEVDGYRFDAALEADRELRWLEQRWPIVQLAFFLLLVAAFGLSAALWLGPARNFGGLIGHWGIGYLSHRSGERPFEIEGATETGTNRPWLGWISFGEGYHANHHAMPASARMGLRPRELDLGWWSLVLLERLGLVTDLRSWSRANAGLRPGARPRDPMRFAVDLPLTGHHGDPVGSPP